MDVRYLESGCGSPQSQADYAVALAHWGRMEVLKEKVKQRMEAHYGKKLDKLADLIAEVALERAKNADGQGKSEEELEAAFMDLNAGAK